MIVNYLDSQFNPTSPDKAVLVKVLKDDGGIVFGLPYKNYSFPDHEGRPGLVGGSLPRDESGGAASEWGQKATGYKNASAANVNEVKQGLDTIAAKLSPHVAEAISKVLERVEVDNNASAAGHWAAAYGGGRLSVNMARFADGRTYQTWDETYKENVTHDLHNSLAHELGHAAEHAIANTPLRQSWRDTVGLATGAELDSQGIEKVKVALKPELAKRREFKPGGDYDWDKIGWTYKGYRRLNEDWVNYERDSSGRVRNLVASLSHGKTTYVRATFKPPSSYAGSNARELFADSFMMYHTAPDKLKSRAPEIYDWMDKWHKSK